MNWQWRFISILIGFYALAGIVLGAAAGCVLAVAKRDQAKGGHQIAAVFTLALVYSISLSLAHERSKYEYLALASAALMGIVLLAALVLEQWRERVLFLAGPFSVSFWLLGPVWAQHEIQKTRLTAPSGLGLPLLVLLFVVVAAAIAQRLRRGPPSIPVRTALATLACVGVLALPGVTRSRIPSPPTGQIAELQGKPNIVLITMDTVRADHLSLYGYERDTTPNLRKFARTATLYSRAIATSDFTLPTHASIFTGLYPSWLGPIYSPPPRPIALPLQPEHTTLAEILRTKGYWTLESVANHVYLSPSTGLTKGFMFSEWTRPVDFSSNFRGFYLRDRVGEPLGRWFANVDIYRPYRSAIDIGLRGLDLIDKAKSSGRPFFLFLNFMDAHWPYDSDPPFNTRFSGQDTGFRKAVNFTISVNRGDRVPTQSELHQLIAQYDNGIAAEDSVLAMLIEGLRKRGLFENTLIVLTADHGEGFMEHGILDHAQGLVDQTYLHVPLLVKYVGQSEGAQSGALVSQVDILPTILEGAGFPSPVPLQGRSLTGPPRDESTPIFAEAQASMIDSPKRGLGGLRRAIFKGPMKLVWWSEGPPEMYDLAVDAGEEHNLYRPLDPRAVDLSKRLADWVAAVPQPRTTTHKLDRSTIERLRSLGYVQ